MDGEKLALFMGIAVGVTIVYTYVKKKKKSS